jgi:hypothetical protein
MVAGLSPTLHGFGVKDGAPANDMTMDAELAAPPHIVRIPALPAPLMIVVTRDIAKGATAVALTRALDPTLGPLIQLPSAVLPKPDAPKPASAP